MLQMKKLYEQQPEPDSSDCIECTNHVLNNIILNVNQLTTVEVCNATFERALLRPQALLDYNLLPPMVYKLARASVQCPDHSLLSLLLILELLLQYQQQDAGSALTCLQAITSERLKQTSAVDSLVNGDGWEDWLESSLQELGQQLSLSRRIMITHRREVETAIRNSNTAHQFFNQLQHTARHTTTGYAVTGSEVFTAILEGVRVAAPPTTSEAKEAYVSKVANALNRRHRSWAPTADIYSILLRATRQPFAEFAQTQGSKANLLF